MKINFINKHGNIEELDVSSNPHRAKEFDNIGWVYFEKKEVVIVKNEEIDYKKLLKDNGVKATHLLWEEKAKAKCEELWLL